MPKVAINDEHMCLYDKEKTTWLFFFIQTLQLKLQNVVTQIQRNKICVLNKNVGIHLTLSYQTNSTSVQRQKYPSLILWHLKTCILIDKKMFH